MARRGLMARRLRRQAGPGAIPRKEPRAVNWTESMRREVNILRPNMAPAASTPFDWRGSVLAIGAGTTVLFTKQVEGGRDLVLKRYGCGYLGTSPIPAPSAVLVWNYDVLVNGQPLSPEESIPGYFTMPSPTPLDEHLINCTVRLRSENTLSVSVTNTTGLLLDLWFRATGWSYTELSEGV